MDSAADVPPEVLPCTNSLLPLSDILGVPFSKRILKSILIELQSEFQSCLFRRWNVWNTLTTWIGSSWGVTWESTSYHPIQFHHKLHHWFCSSTSNLVELSSIWIFYVSNDNRLMGKRCRESTHQIFNIFISKIWLYASQKSDDILQNKSSADWNLKTQQK